MFTLNENVNAKERQQIYGHFLTYQENNENDLQKLQRSMLCDFQNVQNFEPNFVFHTLLPKIDKWNLKWFQMTSIQKLKKKLKPKHRKQEIKIFKLISHIDFTQLTYMNLTNLILDTIQPLVFMKLEKLVSLYAQFGYITSLKSIAKIYLPKLTYLALDHNKYTDQQFKYFARMHFGKKPITLRTIPQGHGIHFSIKLHLFKLDQKFAHQYLIDYTHNDYDKIYREVMLRKFK